MNYFLWKYFGNDDDGPIGDLSYNPEQKDTIWIRIKWWLRNPMHNACFYVWGLADKKVEHQMIGDRDTLGWVFALCWDSEHPEKKYPFIGHNGKYQWYIGWRPDRGAFGLKFRKNSAG